jgi:hypothetical protein
MPENFGYGAELFASDGVFGQAHSKLAELVNCNLASSNNNQNTVNRVKLAIVHDCQEARRWLDEQNSGSVDYHVARVEINDRRSDWCVRTIAVIDQLLECDKEIAFFLRNAFAGAIALTVEPQKDLDVFVPDPNFEHGGESFVVSGKAKEFIQQQFSYRAGLWELDNILKTVRGEMQRWSERNDAPWIWLGNLYFDPPLSRKSRSRITKDNDSNLGVAVLGLSIALASRMRQITSGQFSSLRYSGLQPAELGRPCWDIVAEYVNCAFNLQNAETPESLRQRWHYISRRRKITVHDWTRAAIRQPQFFFE